MIKPSKKQVCEWGNKKANLWLRGLDDPNESREEFIARKAFCAAMEQAALICDELGQNDGVTCAEEIRRAIPSEQKE